MIRKFAEIFCWKNVSSFCIAKATHIFSAKNIILLYIESAKTVNEMTLNELVKLTTLWTTGPRIHPYREYGNVSTFQLNRNKNKTKKKQKTNKQKKKNKKKNKKQKKQKKQQQQKQS